MSISNLALNMSDLTGSMEMDTETRAGAPPAEAEPAGPSVEPWPASEEGLAKKMPTLRSRIADAETHAILGALENTDWNRKQAARLLAISYRGLLYKIRRHNIVRGK
jgi:transcriptional regulator with GAF, ATPase, and Fis domain